MAAPNWYNTISACCSDIVDCDLEDRNSPNEEDVDDQLSPLCGRTLNERIGIFIEDVCKILGEACHGGHENYAQLVPGVDFDITKSLSIPPCIEVVVPPNDSINEAVEVHEGDSCNHAAHGKVSLSEEVVCRHVDDDDCQCGEDRENDCIDLVNASSWSIHGGSVVHCEDGVLCCSFLQVRFRFEGFAT